MYTVCEDTVWGGNYFKLTYKDTASYVSCMHDVYFGYLVGFDNKLSTKNISCCSITLGPHIHLHRFPQTA